MTHPVRARTQAFEAMNTRQVVYDRASRSLVKKTEKAADAGLVACARIQAASYATHVGLTHLAMASAEASHLLDATPASDPLQRAELSQRLDRVVDAFSRVVVSEIADMGW